MNLKRKLLTVFGALAILSLVTAGLTLWMLSRWNATTKLTENHYQRSLLLQRVRATMFRAFKEVPDAVTGDDLDSEEEFNEYIKPAFEDFARWSELADTEEEREQVRLVRDSFDVLVADAKETFALVKAGKMREAFDLMEGRLEDKGFTDFQNLTEAAAQSDRNKREEIRRQNEQTRSTARIVLTVSAFATLSLVFLLAAYLASDLFKPLGELKAALERVAHGDLKQNLPEDRNDEFGEVNRAYNSMLQTIARRERLAGENSTGGFGDDEEFGDETTSRLALHTLVGKMRTDILEFAAKPEVFKNQTEADALVQKRDKLSQAIVRVTEFGFPIDLNLSQTNVRDLLYDAVLRFYDELSGRGISLDLQISPDVGSAMIDRLKIREVITELVRNALRALPETGGQIGLRARTADGFLLVEVADNGKGADEEDLFDKIEARNSGQIGSGLRLSKAVVEKHGGKMQINSAPGAGAFVQIALPLRKDV